MSVFVSSQVWQRYPEGGGELTLALALADHSHDDGTHIWPKIKTLAAKTRQSTRTVQYQLRKMEASGWIVLVNAGNGGRNMSREYVINANWLKGADFASLEKGAGDNGKGATGDIKGATTVAPADNHHQSSSKRKRATALPTDWKLPKKYGLWALEDPTLLKRGGWDEEHVRLNGDMFHDHWVGLGKPMVDWFATWRNWCRKPWNGPDQLKRTNGNWRASTEEALAKAKEVGVTPAMSGESKDAWYARIQAAIENGGKPPVPRHVPVTPLDPVLSTDGGRSAPSDVSRAAMAGMKSVVGSKVIGASQQ